MNEVLKSLVANGEGCQRESPLYCGCLMAQGTLKDHEVPEIQAFIKQHHAEMFAKWSERSAMGYFGG